MFCKHCGKRIDEDSKFCSACGKAVAEGGNSAAPQRSVGKSTLFSTLRTVLFLLLSAACMVPLGFAEYHRIVEMSGGLDLRYWLLAAPVILSVFFLYQAIGAPVIAKEKERIEQEREEGGTYQGTPLLEMRCRLLSFCLLPLAVIAFAISGVINWLF